MAGRREDGGMRQTQTSEWPGLEASLPRQNGLYYGGAWHAARSGAVYDSRSPSTGALLASVAHGGAQDAEAAIAAAKKGFAEWRRVPPLERAKILRAVAAIVREHARELALIDAADCGNPVTEMVGDAGIAAAQLDFFAGLVTEMKGASIPMGPDTVNFSVREPLGVVARILPFNHPFMFCAGKMAAPLAAGNAVIMKPPEQSPLSALRLAELCGHLFPPGALSIVPGGRELGAVLAAHKDVAMVALIGSVPTGRAVMRAASDTVKPVLLELGGKNALIAYADADPDEVAAAVVGGMNFTWCGQSCGSTSRAFLHADIYDAVIKALPKYLARFKPGLPTDPATTMGAIVSEAQFSRVMNYIDVSMKEGATLHYGGGRPKEAALAKGFFIEPTVFGVTHEMTIAREEIFGPVLGVQKWEDEADMFARVNNVDYGLTCSIWTNDLSRAHRAAAEVDAGYVWVNEGSKHFLGAPFGGVKQSGIGREECLGELLAFTREKNIHIRLKSPKGA